jgi:hypothetical protein
MWNDASTLLTFPHLVMLRSGLHRYVSDTNDPEAMKFLPLTFTTSANKQLADDLR